MDGTRSPSEPFPGYCFFMLIDFAAITHQGRVRKNNEDAYLVSALDGEEPSVNRIPRLRSLCPMGLLAAVADGMGGAAAGEIASREGLMAVAMYLFGHWGRFEESQANEAELFKVLKGAVFEASAAVLRWSDDERTARGMGSTLTAAFIWNGHAYLAQVGDSRAYLYRRPDLAQLTVDQTLVGEMVSSGFITLEQAKTHPQRSMITQALGCPQQLTPVLGKVQLCRGDRLLLCSDGLHGELDDARIQEILERGFSAKRSVELLVEAALENGGRDNVTVLLLSLDDPALPLPKPGEPIRALLPEAREAGAAPMGLFSKLGRIFSGKP